MHATSEVHVRLTGPLDADAASDALARHGLSAVVDRERSELELGCAAGDEERMLAVVSLVLDEWLADQRLPFVPARAGADTLVLRPPAD